MVLFLAHGLGASLHLMVPLVVARSPNSVANVHAARDPWPLALLAGGKFS